MTRLALPLFLLAACPAALAEDRHGGRHEHGAAMHGEMGQSQVDTSSIRQTAHFRVAYRSEATPIPINRLHSWRLQVTTPHGAPVTGADISVTGDMPAHGHGLPTQPEVTREVADGVYIVEGMKFHMPGHWVVEFQVAANGNEDTVAFDLVLK